MGKDHDAKSSARRPRYIDIIEALRRTAQYQEDWQILRRLYKQVRSAAARKAAHQKALKELTTHEKHMRQRWKICAPFPPPAGHSLLAWEEDRPSILPVLDGLPSVYLVHPVLRDLHEDLAKLIKGYDPLRMKVQLGSARTGPNRLTKSIEGGKHLCLIVDVTHPELELVNMFKAYIKTYSQRAHSRNKPTTRVDIWDVYDRIQAGETYSQIVKCLQPSIIARRDSQNINNVYAASYSVVTKAHKKAALLVKKSTPPS